MGRQNCGKGRIKKTSIKKLNTEEVKIVFSKRARNIAISILPNGEVILRAPIFANRKNINEAILKNKDWIEKKRNFLLKNVSTGLVRVPEEMREKAGKFLYQKCISMAKIIERNNNLPPFNILKIKDMRTRWGTANSLEKIITINWKAVFLDDEILHYLLAHELSHFKEPNHSEAFWREVEKIVPDYDKKRKILKNTRMDFIEGVRIDTIRQTLLKNNFQDNE